MDAQANNGQLEISFHRVKGSQFGFMVALNYDVKTIHVLCVPVKLMYFWLLAVSLES